MLLGLNGVLEQSQFVDMQSLTQNLDGRISALPDGPAKQSFVDQLNKVKANVLQIQSKRDYLFFPALFASEYKTNMAVLQYLDQQLAARTAEPTVVQSTPAQPMQSIAPFTSSGGGVPVDMPRELWMTPTVQASPGGTYVYPDQDGGSFLKTFLVLSAVGAVGYFVFKHMGSKKRS